jgi:hypothetical protein
MTAVDIIATAEGMADQFPLEVSPSELLFKLADDSLLSRNLAVIGRVCDSVRDGSQSMAVVSKKKTDLDAIVACAQKLGINVISHALHTHYSVLVRHQHDVFVSYLCQDRNKSWKYTSLHADMMNIRKVLYFIQFHCFLYASEELNIIVLIANFPFSFFSFSL